MITENQSSSLVKKQTVIFITAAAFILGFLGGIVFTVFKAPQQTQPVAQQQQQAPQGQQAAQGGITPEHIAGVEQEAAANPDNPDIWIHLGTDYLQTSQYEKAITAFSKSLEISPNNPNVLTDLGVMYRRVGKFDKALESFDKALQLDPKHEQARFNKGVVYISDLNDPEGAVKVWEELLQANPLAQAPNGQSLQDIVTQVKADIAKQQGEK